MAGPAPIVLPTSTVTGDETDTLLLPATPEISHLSGARTSVRGRAAAPAETTITLVDPVTFHAADQIALVQTAAAPDQDWLLIDANLAGSGTASPSRIRWDSHPS
jgi:hypothetical protein